MSHPDYNHIGEPEDRLVEEVGELLQALGKAKRFGWFAYHPEHPDKCNMTDVKEEMDDVVEVMEKLEVKMRDLRCKYYENTDNK